MTTVALIPFSTRLELDQAAHIARGLTLELSDWLKARGADPMVLTSAQTDEDGAWRRLVSFADELSAETVTEFVTGLAQQGENVNGEFSMAVSGVIDALAGGNMDRGLSLSISVTDVAGAFSRGRFVAEATQSTFRDAVPALFRQVATALGVDVSSEYDPGTRHFQVWLNLLVTRALILAAEVGAVPRDATGLYEPALEAAAMDPACGLVRDRLGELCQVLVLERGFEAKDAAGALEVVMRKIGPDWKSHRVRGQLMLAAGLPSDAAKAFCQLLQGRYEAPDPREKQQAALMAGRAFNMAERHLEAQRVLRLAMDAETLKVEAIVESAASSAGLGEAAIAERLWRRALELEPNSVSARLHLARHYRQRGEVEKAAEQYEALVRLPALPREVFADAAEYFVVNQRPKEALDAAERYAAEFPGDAIAHLLLASALNTEGRHKRALESLDKAELCVGVGEMEDLVRRQRRFAAYPDVEHRFRKLAGEALEGEPAAAETALSELLAAHPDFLEAQMFLGITLRRQQRWEQAREVFEDLREKSRLPGIDKELTGIYSQLDQPAKALECAKRAMEAAPEDATLITNYAAALLENGEIDDAMRYAQRAEMLMPGDEPTRKLLDLVELRMRKRGLLANFRAVMKEATGWWKATRRRKPGKQEPK